MSIAGQLTALSLVLAACLVFFGSTSHTGPGQCPGGFSDVMDRCLKRLSWKYQHSNGSRACESIRAELVMPKTRYDFDRLMAWDTRNNRIGRRFWLGIDNQETGDPSIYTWDDQFNTPVTWTWSHWGSGRPTNKTNRCAVVKRTYPYSWRDDPCDKKRPVICQMPYIDGTTAPTTAPTTTTTGAPTTVSTTSPTTVTTATPTTCQGHPVGTFFPDPSNMCRFFQCGPDFVAYHKTCQPKLKWVQSSRTCDWLRGGETCP